MSTTAIYEIAPDLFRLSIYVPDFDMQFNHFLVRDEEPLLFHAGLRGMFPALREAVAKIPLDTKRFHWREFWQDGLNGQDIVGLIGVLLRDKFNSRVNVTHNDAGPAGALACLCICFIPLGIVQRDH